ncbi:MAG: hypothetical protein WCG95_06915 [bacterium]
MSNKLTIMANFNENYGLEEWVRDNLQILKQTGLELINDTVEMVHDGFIVQNEILDQTFFVKCDKEKSSEYDLGCIVVECSLQEAHGVIWLANSPDIDLKNAFYWLGKSLGPDFETLVKLLVRAIKLAQINNTKIDKEIIQASVNQIII